MSETEQTILQQVERTKERLPDKIANAPEILLGLALYYNGFSALSSTRGALYSSEGPIPWLAMRDYCDENEIYGVQRQDFYDLLVKMDQAYLKFKGKKSKELAQGH